MKLNSHKSLALVLVPLGILVILVALNQTGRMSGKDGRVAASEAAENPAPKPEGYKAKPIGQKNLVAKQPKPAAPAPITRRQPPNGGKLGDKVQFLTDPAEGDPLDIALNYVLTPENRPGYTEADFKNLKISSRYVSKHNGVTHLYLRQSHEGIEVYGGDIGVSLMPDGSIINLHNAFVTDLAGEVNRIDPVITAQEAIRSAATFYSLQETAALATLEVPEPDPVAKKQLFSPAGISLDPIPAKLTYVPLEEGVTRLAWNMVIRFNDGERWLDLNVDAETGEVLSEANWIACVKCAAHGVEMDEAHDCGEEPPPRIASETSSVTGTNYNVFSLPLESPSDGGRSVLIDPQNTAASPFGWHDTDGAAGAEFTDTRGNNVNAQEDADNNNTGGVRPSGGASLNFDFPLDLAQAPSTYTPAVTANLFYWNNIIHDVFWHYGFDEPAGNFQENNYGNGGAASDPVEADSQDGSGTNNANFGTPPDGSNPRMQMYIWTQANPDRDSSLDNAIIIHEYGHGISNRLTGGPANSSALSTNQSRGMGEGWSDFLGLALTHQTGDTGATGRGIGTYVLGQASTDAGIRPFRYSTDLLINPQHFGNLNGGGLSVPHGIGSVWCTALWELYWALVDVHGYNPNLYTGTGGNNIALQLVIDGMKLQPANPSFLDARDAILMADQVNNGGANSDTIWAAFAKRGMGSSAYDGGSSSSLAVIAAFDLPDDLNITPGLRASFVSTGPVGGPLVPSSQTYTLENIGDASLNWTASDNVTWLDLSAVAGTLAAAATTTVNATINANANVLGLGIHPAIVTFTNTVSGKTITRNVTLQVNDFAAALDSPALTYGTSGVPWFSQTTTTKDGVDAAQSGVMGDGQTSSLQTTLTGPGKFTFWWKVSSEANYDFLRLYLNDVEQTGSLARISGNVDWVQRTVSIPLGSHTVRWSYTKDSAEIGGSDAAWLDQVVWLPLPLNTVEVFSPNGGETAYLSSSQTITWAANITGNVKIDLFKGGSFHSVLAANEPNDGSYSWSVSAGLPAASDYTVKVSSVDNPAYSDTSNAAFTIIALPTLADALDTTGLTWLTSGNLPWFPQTATTNDGADAARSGAITHNQTSSVETTLTGPGQLSFWWKVSSETNWDFLRFYINGVEQSGSLVRISGDVNWVQKTVAIPAGSQTVKWSYTKDSSVNSGSDAAWVDQVAFTSSSTPEIAVEQPVGTNLVDGSASIDCGVFNLSSSSAPITFTVKNIGAVNLTGMALSKDGADNADFTLGSLGATTLAPGASTTFTVTFSPSAVGSRTAAIHLASNDSDENPFDIALTGTGVVRADPLAVTGGPYSVLFGQALMLNAGASQPSYPATITAYEWDLDGDGVFGDGSTPETINSPTLEISYASLTGTWNRIPGPNTIRLRVTDSANKTSEVVTTILTLVTSITWDANGTGANRTDGVGTWLNTNQWWDGTKNVTWATDSNAIIGNGGAGGAITLGDVNTGTIQMDNFTGTYTLQGTGNTLTQSGGITIGAAAGTVTFRGTAATTGLLTIAGTGGITKNGAGTLILRENLVPSYTGQTTVNNGIILMNGGSKSSGNFNLNGGMLSDYYQQTGIFSSGLGTGTNQIQIYDSSGFGGGNGTSTWRIGATGSTLVWGAGGEGTATGFFNPTTLRLRSSVDNNGPSIYGNVTLDNRLDLNSGARIISVLRTGASLSGSRARIDDGIQDTGGTGSLTKNGDGLLFIGSATSTWGGTTTINGGLLDFAATNHANISGGSGRDITVAAGAAVRFDALSNAIFNRIVETTSEIGIFSGGTANSFDFSSTAGATLPNAFLGIYATNGAKGEFSGTITPGSNGYKLGAFGSEGLLGIVGSNKLTGTSRLTVGGTGGSGIRVELAADNNFSGNTVITSGAKLTLGNNRALQNSALNLGSAGGTFALSTGALSGEITGSSASPSPTFGGLIGSRNLYSAFSSSAGNNEQLLANTAVTGFTLNVGTGLTHAYSGAIGGFGTGAGTGGAAGTLGNSTLTKTGPGTQILSGSSTYTGATTVSEGTLTLGANNVLPNASAVSIGAVTGTATLNAATFDDTLGTLDVTGSASINLDTGANIAFADSSAIDWTGGTLNLTGTFVPGSSLRFGTSNTGLSSGQLALISKPGGGPVALDSNGYLIDGPLLTLTGAPIVAVNTTYGMPSPTPTSFSVSGSNLSPAAGNLIVAALAGFEYSTSPGGTYTSTLSLTYTGGTISSTEVFVRLAAYASVAGSPYSGNISVSGGGAAPTTIATIPSTVGKVIPTVTVTVGSYTYTGLPQGPTAYTTSPTGDTGAPTWSYVGTDLTSYGPSVTLPTDAGSYTATVALAADNNFHAASSSATAFTIASGNGYQAWSGGAVFDADSNGDGVENGLAWLLGAADKDVSAIGLLPVVTQNNGNLILTFKCLNAAKRGSAVLNVQYSKDLGISDLWASHDSAVVPGTAPATVTVGGVDFVSSVFDANLNNIQATIPASAALPGTQLFGRLNAISAP